MKKPFEKGDRVRVYGHSQLGTVDAGIAGLKGTVFTAGIGFLNVSLDNKKVQTDAWNTWYTQQCRRLKKKEERVAREWTLRVVTLVNLNKVIQADGPMFPPNHEIKVREVLEEK